MTKRPRSSVTTILANFVGRSVVSAITHTPASGPFVLVTTPPMSSGSRATVAAGRCRALTQVNEVARTTAAANDARPGFPRALMCSSNPDLQLDTVSPHGEDVNRRPCIADRASLTVHTTGYDAPAFARMAAISSRLG